MRCGCSGQTRLAGGVLLEDHDDWSCLDDAEAHGLIKNEGTGLNRVYSFTSQGIYIMQKLQVHRHGGGSFAAFTLDASVVPTPK